MYIFMDIHGKFVDMDMDMDGKFHIHGKPGQSGCPSQTPPPTLPPPYSNFLDPPLVAATLKRG